MKIFIFSLLISFTFTSPLASGVGNQKDQLKRVKYNNPNLIVDLGVGISPWPVPMDGDGDGDYDLYISIAGKPSGGTYFFENTSGDTSKNKFPVLKDGVRVSRGYYNITPSYVDGRVIVAARNLEFPDYPNTGLEFPVASGKFQPNVHRRKVHLNQWRYLDYDNDGDLDISIGVTDWGDYGWDNIGAFSLGFDDMGNWINGPIRGHIYIIKNLGTTKKPIYGPSKLLKAEDKVIDGYGIPSQSFEDFDNDGDLDLMTGEFLDGFTYYRNNGTRSKPKFIAGVRLSFTMDLQFIMMTALDWDKDGDIDLIVGQEDGRVALIEHTGKVDKTNQTPLFKVPRFFQQQAGALKFGALITPVGIDWDGDGDEDIVAGNSAGYIGFFENLAGPGKTPVWARPEYISANNEIIRILAGPNGSIQGPSEAKWGYTTLSVADWDNDGLHDLIVNSIWGKVIWYKNIGTKNIPEFDKSQAIIVEPGGISKPKWNWWDPVNNELATQWRTTPVAYDWNQDGLTDLIMLDQEGYLAFFERLKKNHHLILLPAKRIFLNEKNQALKLSRGDNGASGRRKLHLVDWDNDGKVDLLADDKKTNVRFYRNITTASLKDDKTVILKDMGPLDSRLLARHTTSPTTVDWDGNGIRDLLVGAEDGRLYFMKNNMENSTK